MTDPTDGLEHASREELLRQLRDLREATMKLVFDKRAPRDFAIALLVREVLCEQVYRRRGTPTLAAPEHICRALGLRDVPLEKVVAAVRVTLHELPKDELRAFAARVLDEALKE